VAEAGRRSRLRRLLVHGRHLLTRVVGLVVDGGGGGTLQVVVVISVPSPIIINKFSCVEGGSAVMMVLGTGLCRKHIGVSQSLDDLVLVGFSIWGGSPDIGK
jgi:hypothetical protein